MGLTLLNLVFSSIGKCIDVICLLLDLNFVIVSSVIQLLVAVISFINSLPMLLTNSVSECWNLSLLCIITMRDGVTVVTHNMFGGWMQLLGGLLESFKMIGYLSSHLLLRTKELLHRGLLSGHSLLRQAWEGCGIVFSLLLYFINTIINLLLIGTQNLYSVVVSTVEAVSCPLQKALELTLTVLTFLYSSLVGTSILLWTPCRLAMEFLGSVCHVFVSTFLLNSYGLLLTLIIIVSATVYLNPMLPRLVFLRVINYINTVPILQRLQRALHRLYLLERNVWWQLAWNRSQIMVPARMEMAERDVRQPDPNPEPQVGLDVPENTPEDAHQVDESINPPLPSSSTHKSLRKFPSQDSCKGPPADNLLTLLQEQEERKKCVICQDSTKTVVLLPCRHLCLCRDCTNILLSQPVDQQNCPLCRHMILQTMDVYL
ncbi:E3 ubiquitin-protein ligase RNF26 isoform X1 [Carassius gibelio]|uniref:E3 ubiquitin-protein ligase RNF26 isoform X1 n=1 Tax=Carassius gibelio TaxID=101364 RepID=UPI0022787B10|nr:E3 ubiquitin-protein ligase RNF26 isoform X1 [Carassius gibelio]